MNMWSWDAFDELEEELSGNVSETVEEIEDSSDDEYDLFNELDNLSGGLEGARSALVHEETNSIETVDSNNSQEPEVVRTSEDTLSSFDFYDNFFDEDEDILVERQEDISVQSVPELSIKKLNNGLHSRYVPESKQVDLSEKKVKREHPLDNSKTREIVIGPNGRTLADYFVTKRSKEAIGKRAKTKQDLIERSGVDVDLNHYIRNREKNNIVGQREFTKGISEVKNKFLDSNRKVKTTRADKQIAKSLGISGVDLSSIVGSQSKLSEKEKAELLSSFRFKDNNIKIKGEGKRYKTLGNKGILEYLYKVKYATTKNISLALGIKFSSIHNQLTRLLNLGLVIKHDVFNSVAFWELSSLGGSVIDVEVSNRKKIATSSLSERLYVNHVIGCLYSNKVDILDRGSVETFPYKGRLENGEYVSGETIVTESEIMSSMSRMQTEIKGGVGVKDSHKNATVNQLKNDWEIAWRRWRNSGGVSPEMVEGNEWLYMLFYEGDITTNWVLPDIVVRRPRLSDGSPQSIAIEVEKKTDRSIEYYVKKLKMYLQDFNFNRVYGKVVYITPHKSVALKIIEAAEILHISSDRLSVEPMLDGEGNRTKEVDPWLF